MCIEMKIFPLAKLSTSLNVCFRNWSRVLYSTEALLPEWLPSFALKFVEKAALTEVCSSYASIGQTHPSPLISACVGHVVCSRLVG